MDDISRKKIRERYLDKGDVGIHAMAVIAAESFTEDFDGVLHEVQDVLELMNPMEKEKFTKFVLTELITPRGSKAQELFGRVLSAFGMTAELQVKNR